MMRLNFCPSLNQLFEEGENDTNSQNSVSILEQEHDYKYLNFAYLLKKKKIRLVITKPKATAIGNHQVHTEI